MLLRYGKDILESTYFSAAEHQVHHLFSTVASHSVNTALLCLLFVRLLKPFRIRLNLSVLIAAALAHDLGMIDRRQKYASDSESYRIHPDASVQILKLIRPDADQKTCEAIAVHMYPVTTRKPASKEAWALCIADKLAACADWFIH